MSELGNLTNAAMAIAMIAAALLLFGGVKLVRQKPTRTQGVLMITAAAVLVMNVMIWTV